MRTLVLWILATAALSAGPAVTLRVADLDNHAVDPFAGPAGTKATVLLFTTTECPISNGYAPTIAKIHDQFARKGVRFWLIYPNAADTPELIRDHVKAYRYPMQALRDPQHALAMMAHATVTPEAAVFDRQGKEVYHGRIDDRYTSVGAARPSATKHDLQDVLTATLAGKPVAEAVTPAVGCFIE
jgi:hypothetical protein